MNILENSADYQPLAIEAAKNEFFNRKLSDMDIKEAKEHLINNQFQRERQGEKVKAIEVKLKTTGKTLFDTLNPIQSGIHTKEKTLKLITIVFSGIFLFQVFNEFSTIIDYAQDLFRFPIGSVLVLFPFILLPFGIITFWKRKSLGWTLLTMYLTFSIVGVLWVLLNPGSWRQSSLAITEKLFPRPSLTIYFLQLLFLLATLYIICKQNIREVFLINPDKMTKTIVLSGILAFILLIFS